MLSLDAPLVAVLWQSLFAQVFNVSLAWHHALLLAACVWLVYSADRLFDGWLGRLSGTRRHLFYNEHRLETLALWLAVFGVSFPAAFTTLHRGEIMSGLLVLAAVLLYLVRVHFQSAARFFVPKEVQVALIFGVGVTLFLIPNLISVGAVGHLVLPLGLFSVLCLLNCSLISHWERGVDAQPLERSLIRYSSLRSRLPQIALILACLAVLLTLLDREVAPLYGAVAGSALLLFELSRTTLGPPALRVLADAALLTPAPILLVLWLMGLGQ